MISKLVRTQREDGIIVMVQLLFTLSSHMLSLFVRVFTLKRIFLGENILKVTDDNTIKKFVLVAFFLALS